MIIVRNTFQLKFGKAKDAKVLIKESLDLMKRNGNSLPRYMTDLTGEFYTLVMETQYNSLADMEKEFSSSMGSPEFEQWYNKFVPLVESGHREIFSLVN